MNLHFMANKAENLLHCSLRREQDGATYYKPQDGYNIFIKH